ncbi:MAG: hypothetical protein HY726_23445 [Candidatus Rokubacteria bacterium]|nr:hypothetical protein [Candidatus Rokubacteria bacterium]
MEDEAWERLDPPQRRQRILDAIKRLLLRESQVQPLMVLFEDLHWIDAETQALLDSLVESLPGARLLLLVNYRPEYTHGWGSKTYYRQLQIDPCPPRAPRPCSTPSWGATRRSPPLPERLLDSGLRDRRGLGPGAGSEPLRFHGTRQREGEHSR